MILMVISFIQIGKESPLSTLFKGFFPQINIMSIIRAKFGGQKQDSSHQSSKAENDFEDETFEGVEYTTSTFNATFFKSILAQIFLSVIYFICFIMITFDGQVNAHYGSWITVLVSIGILIAFEEHQK